MIGEPHQEKLKKIKFWNLTLKVMVLGSVGLILN